MIRSLPLTALSLLLGFFFIFVGLIKVSPSINAEIHRDMKQEFGRFNKVFPLYQYTGWRPLAKNYRLVTGYTEIICGATLVIIPGPAKEVASVLLLIIMGGGFYTHFSLGDSFERMAPSLIFGLLIVCRLIILHQVTRKENQELEMLRKFIEESQSSTSISELLKNNGNNKEESGSDDNHSSGSKKNGQVEKEKKKVK